ncbi:hypothetical protein [Sporanaerobacter sp. PP17-6a]|uniref:hypothetical protein n=1 Tax=Sporanaerobacter sp. PP17-6a TaxID=1891289 RepID=UPI0008A0070C|nr:hypothetical protein [Sporanaerobacter sp. PP17-6a]SCL88717.1 hypothetical protein PP176A_1600 [Sporanaerobacter sp. PP17-6a]
MKLRIVQKKQIKRAYEKKKISEEIISREGRKKDVIDKVPDEMFLILKETLSFVEKINIEEENNENK